ncbi:MAG: hypothetical protein V8Q44_04700 [Alistipes ihumii]
MPIKKVKSWAWESFWIVQGIFAWLVFPFLGALLGVPQGMGLFELLGTRAERSNRSFTVYSGASAV